MRGLVGPKAISPAFAYNLAKSVSFLAPEVRSGVVCIGRDTRKSGNELAKSLAHGFRQIGFEVDSLGVIPTPGVSFCTKHSAARLGVVVTASHNPFQYNGFKFFNADGTKIDVESNRSHLLNLISGTESSSSSRTPLSAAETSARSLYLHTLEERARRVGKLPLKGVVDCAHGATAEIGPSVLSEIVSDVHYIGTAPSGININDGVGSTSLVATQTAVLETGADFGIAFDGDGDRVLFVDDAGREVSGDQILFLLARYRLSAETPNGVVGTEMSNEGLARALNQIGIEFSRAQVGDKHVLEKLTKKGWQLGGEPSGHVIWLQETNSGDGLWVALCVLEILKETGGTLRELLSEITLLPQAIRSVNIAHQAPFEWDVLMEDVVRPVALEVKDSGRVLVRRSGTEPILRVMVEHLEESAANSYADQLSTAISNWLRRA